jgi:hypothetical protein
MLAPRVGPVRELFWFLFNVPKALMRRRAKQDNSNK